MHKSTAQYVMSLADVTMYHQSTTIPSGVSEALYAAVTVVYTQSDRQSLLQDRLQKPTTDRQTDRQTNGRTDRIHNVNCTDKQ